MISKRIAIAEFQHETNCFNPKETILAHFEMADSWPRLLEADEVVARTRGMNLTIAGFIDAALEAGFNFCPIILFHNMVCCGTLWVGQYRGLPHD